MPTLRDRMRQRQWQQEVQTATLSLPEIAARWAHLECGEASTESVIHDYLREIASQLSKSQQLRRRLERGVIPTSPTSVPQTGVADPWQALHKMRNELRAVAAGDREAAAKLRFTDSTLRTYLGGSASQPPAGLFPVPSPPQPQGAQADTNGTDENLVPEGVEPTPLRAGSQPTVASTDPIPPPIPEPCIACPPINKDDWFSVIQDAAQDFRAKKGRCPENYTEMWAWLHGSPPRDYGVSSVRDRGEKALSLPGGSLLPKRSFKERWRRYTCGTKGHKET